MPYNPYPRAFQTKGWRQLYESYILDLATLKTAANGAALVIFDAEPWGADHSMPAELGVSLLQSQGDKRMSADMPRTLEGISEILQLETHWIRVTGRERQEKTREKHRFGQLHNTKDEQVEEVISGIIEKFMHKHYGQSHDEMSPTKTPLILAGFSLDFEFRVLSRLYPKLLPHFTSWLDLQEIAREMASDSAGRLTSPGLHETLFACGFDNHPEGAQSTRSQHNAATDTVRAAAIFAYGMAWHGRGGTLEISVSSRRTNHSRNYRHLPTTPGQKKVWNGMRPKPKEFYPYGARVSRPGETIDLDAQELLDLFATTHELTAVGIGKGKRYGWVCLPGIEALQSFVRHVDGSTLDDGHVWKVVSDFDPAIVPARDWYELKSRQRLQLKENAEEKREQGNAKREALKAMQTLWKQ